MIVVVHVGVALSRPYKLDEYRRIVVEADSATEGRLIACQIAACTSKMVVQADTVEVKVSDAR